MADPYKHDIDAGIPDQVQGWIDARMHGALKSAGGFTLQALTRGVLKGLLVTGSIATAVLVATGITAPEMIGLPQGLSVPEAVQGGLMFSGNALLGSIPGLFLLAAGGGTGYLLESKFSSQLTPKEAKQQAALLEAQRKNGRDGQEPACSFDDPSPPCPTGHCAQMMNNNKHRGSGGRWA